MDLLNVIVEVNGIISRKELNGQYGIATAYDDAKGRVAVQLLSDRSMVSLKAANLSDWAAARRDVATKISTDDINAVRSGAALSQEPDIAKAIYDKALNPPGGDAVRLELLRGGVVEMLVQSMDAHMADRARCCFALFYVSNLLVAFQTADDFTDEFSLAAEAKDRAVAAGYFERLCRALRAQKTSDCQSSAVSGFMQGTSGGAFVATEARREAAVKAGGLEAVISAMKLAPHRSAVQHFGILSLTGIVALGCAPGTEPNSSRCDTAIRAGAPQLAIEAMSRFAPMRPDHRGFCEHTMEFADGNTVHIFCPGSILQSGCELLSALVFDWNKERASPRSTLLAPSRPSPRLCGPTRRALTRTTQREPVPRSRARASWI